MQVDPKYSKIVIQIILIIMCCIMVFYTGNLKILHNIVFQTVTMLLIFSFGVLIDPTIAILATCLFTIGLINISKMPAHN